MDLSEAKGEVTVVMEEVPSGGGSLKETDQGNVLLLMERKRTVLTNRDRYDDTIKNKPITITNYYYYR